MATVDDLGAVPLFNTLSDAELEELANWFQLKTVGEGVTLAREGASGYSFYLVLDGSAVVTTEDDTVATYDAGDFFGEMAILGDGRRLATVTSTSPARLLVMFGTEFRRLEAAHPEIASRIVEAMQARIAELNGGA
jgi:CRP-like cAMP-binding protein